MQVYKAFYKIILKNLNQLMIYVVVFISLTVALANTNNKPGETNFTETKVNIAYINYDEGSALSEGLKAYLSKSVNLVDIPDETQKLQDALFFRKVEYIVKVPKGFNEGFAEGKAVQLEKSNVPGTTSGIYLDSMINKYLNTAKAYKGSIKNLSNDQLISHIDKDLAENTEVKMKNSVEEVSKGEKTSFYFNYLAYSMYAVLILGVCSVMIVFNNSDLKKRNYCTPVKLRNISFQLILATLSYAVLAWFVMIITSLFMYGSFMFTAKGLLFLLNSLIFTFAALSISFLIANVIKGRNAMSAAANVVSLGTCFISGVFVPQFLLGKSVLTLASFTPNYWYVKSNNIIGTLSNFSMENLAPIFLNMLIVAGFAVAVLSVTLVLIKQKRMSY
jgi:ABC-2 type transport system permease protein